MMQLRYFDTLRLQIAVKVTVTNLIGLWLYLYFNLNLGFLLVLTGLIYTFPSYGSNKRVALSFIIGIAAGVFFEFLVINHFGEFPDLAIIITAAWVFVCFYFTSNPNLSVMMVLASGMAVVTLSYAYLATATVLLQFILSFSTMFFLGGILFFIIGKTLWPHYALHDITQTIYAIMDNFEKTYLKMYAALLKNEKPVISKEKQQEKELIAKLQQLLLDAKLEVKDGQYLEEVTMNFYRRFNACFLNLERLHHTHLEQCKNLVALYKEQFQAIEQSFRIVFSAINKMLKARIVTDIDMSQLIAAIDALDKRHHALRHSEEMQSYPQHESMAVNEFILVNKNIVDNLMDIINYLKIRFSQPRIAVKPRWLDLFKMQYFRVSYSKNQVFIAASAVLSLFASFYIIQYFHWQHASGAIFTALVVAGTNVGKTVQIIKWRATGALLGTLVGFIGLYMLAVVPYLLTLIALISVLSFTLGYYASLGKKQQMILLQLFTAFCFVALPSPTLDILFGNGVIRTFSILMGGAIGFLISFTLTKSAVMMLREEIANNLKQVMVVYQYSLQTYLGVKNYQAEIEQENNLLEQSLMNYPLLLDQAQHEFFYRTAEIHRIIAVATHMQKLIAELFAMQKITLYYQISIVEQQFVTSIQTVNQSLYQWLEHLIKCVLQRKNHMMNFSAEDLLNEIDRQQHQLSQMFTAEERKNFNLQSFSALVNAIKRIIQMVDVINHDLQGNEFQHPLPTFVVNR